MFTRLTEKLRLCLINVLYDPEINAQPLLYPFASAAVPRGGGHAHPLSDCADRFPQHQELVAEGARYGHDLE